jgi:hypothetical protein
VDTCTICATPLDPVWVEIGNDRHSWCVEADCQHGEPRGSRYCALCRYANPLIEPPTPPVSKRRRRRKLVSA